MAGGAVCYWLHPREQREGLYWVLLPAPYAPTRVLRHVRYWGVRRSLASPLQPPTRALRGIRLCFRWAAGASAQVCAAIYGDSAAIYGVSVAIYGGCAAIYGGSSAIYEGCVAAAIYGGCAAVYRECAAIYRGCAPVYRGCAAVYRGCAPVYGVSTAPFSMWGVSCGSEMRYALRHVRYQNA
eukprot:2244868-Rhodomonas_salina.3